jgi:hypothetical protein
MFIYNKMSDARIVLQATGEQDEYLTTNANSTFFKKKYETYSDYGSNWIQLSNNDKGVDNFVTPGNSLYFRINQDGDVINEIYLKIKINKNDSWKNTNFNTYETIFGIIDNIEFLYNDKVLSKFDSDFMFSYFELHYDETQKKKLSNMISYDNALKAKEKGYNSDESISLYVPLPLWFHRNVGLSFPIWALYDSNLGIKVTLKNYDSTNRIIKDIELLTKFSYLNNEEKNKFKNSPLEYLIEQPEKLEKIKLNSDKSIQKISLLKTHYVRYLLWHIKDLSGSNWKKYNKFMYLDDLLNGTIKVNGNELVPNSSSKFFHLINRYKFFNSNGTLYLGNNIGEVDDTTLNPIYTYSFCINPLDYKLSGFITTEKFNQFELTLDIKQGSDNRELNIYSMKHNILRFNKGKLEILFN